MLFMWFSHDIVLVSIGCVALEGNSHGVAFFVKFHLPYVRPFLEFVLVFLESYWISWIGNTSRQLSANRRSLEVIPIGRSVMKDRKSSELTIIPWLGVGES